MIWNPGDDTDLNEGGAENDTVEVNGGNGAEVFTTTANGTRVRFDRLDPAPFSIDIGTSENLVLNANGGDDRVSATGNLAALIKITVDGGTGADTILGSNGIDTLIAGDGADFVDGQQGNDVAFLGAGDDTFQWDPGDGSDTVEGQANADTMLFNGSAANELFEASANGGRVRFTRNVANIVMDLDDVENLDLNALGGTDTLTANDLSGTDLADIDTNLAGSIGGTAGDAAADTVVVNGTNGDDIVDVFGAGTSASVLGLHTRVDIANSEGANDALVINTLGGDDGVTATTLPAGVIKLTVDGGAGEDTLLGSQGADVFLGGSEDDFVFGDNGNDVEFLGAGADVSQWNPGDGNDTLEGQAGDDKLLFFGANVAENVNALRQRRPGAVLPRRGQRDHGHGRPRATSSTARSAAPTTSASGTSPARTCCASTATCAARTAAATARPTRITVNGTQGADVFGAAGDAGGVNVFGLHTQVNAFFQEQANDRLTLNGLGGDDVIDATSLEADGIQLTQNGGLGADVFIGSEGDDLVTGGDGDDTAFLAAGDDTFAWNPGDDNDTLEGQDGFDRMLFNGANVAETINLQANGGRVLFTRDIANVVMDLNDVEQTDFNALGGVDRVTVGDLSGTDMTEVNTNLAGAGGVDDARGRHGVRDRHERRRRRDRGGRRRPGVAPSGSPRRSTSPARRPASDRLSISMLGGDDVVDASGLQASGPALSVDGGDQNDVIIGGDGDDTLLGGDGDDVLLGGPGNDVIDGGPGDNVVIQSLGADTTSAAAVTGEQWLDDARRHGRRRDGARGRRRAAHAARGRPGRPGRRRGLRIAARTARRSRAPGPAPAVPATLARGSACRRWRADGRARRAALRAARR